MNKKLPNFKELYFVTSDKDDTVLLAMDIKINEKDNSVVWFDSVKDRVMTIKNIMDYDPLHFVFERDGDMGGTYTFIPLTLDIYNENVKNKILSRKEFESEQEMTRAFLKTINNSW